jgi:Flp pilus assembly protein TadG
VTPHRRRSAEGQSLAEFAIVFPIFMLFLGGLMQFALLFWAQNTLNQVARDTGRWAATQTFACTTGAEQTAAETSVITMANTIANSSSLLGKTAAWTTTNIDVTWDVEAGTPPVCPPVDNAGIAWINITIRHSVPTFFPFTPGGGAISTATRYRVEPMP